MATGGNWGGLVVDDEFENLVIEIIGKDVYDEFKKENPSDFLALHRNFEVQKRNIKPVENNKMITITLPFSLSETFSKMYPDRDISQHLKNNAKFSSDVKWLGDKMRISYILAKSLFEKSLRSIKEHLTTLLSQSEVKDIRSILLVGGYSECPLLQSLIVTTFPDKRLIIPNDAGLAILRGAVINGHEPDTIMERICRYSYGVATCVPFIPFLHVANYIVFGEDGAYCNNVFSGHLEKNQRIPLFSSGEAQTYYVMFREQKRISIELYTSSEKDPCYCTEESCHMIGKIDVEMLDTRKGKDRGVDVSMTLGGAELQVKAKDIHTKQKRFAYFDFIGSPSQQQIEELLD